MLDWKVTARQGRQSRQETYKPASFLSQGAKTMINHIDHEIEDYAFYEYDEEYAVYLQSLIENEYAEANNLDIINRILNDWSYV